MNDKETYPVTTWKRRDGYAEMLLSDKLGGEDYRLPEGLEYGPNNEIATFAIGEIAVRLFCVEYDEQIEYCGIPFKGDIVAAELAMSARQMQQAGLEAAVQEKIAELFSRAEQAA